MIRSIFRLGVALALPCFLFTTFMLATSSLVIAQNSGVTQIGGAVVDSQRHPVGDAQVRLSGPASKTTFTQADGSFAFLNLPTGTFRLDISKAGFNPAMQNDIVMGGGSTTTLSFTLQPASLTSLTIIGNVSAVARGANTINTTPASIVDVPATTFTDQGQLSVNQVLNEEPGITIGVDSGTPAFSGLGSNGASPLANGTPSIRGGLPYETESLIDGHPISLGQQGFFSPSFISPYLLQNVEVVKGPGATSPSINYAINGTVNYRTLEPTLKPAESVDIGEDQYGGNFANFRITGTLPGDRLSYAFDYVTQGTQGFDRGYTGPGVLVPFGAAYLNGSPINAFGGFSGGAGPSNIFDSFVQGDSLMMCCPTVPQNFNQRNELGKVRYAFTPSTTLTLTWLGGQTTGTYADGYMYPCINLSFTPPAGYTGSLPAGPVNAFAPEEAGWLAMQNTNLFETEFHTPLGNTATLLLRQYSSSIQTFTGGPGDSGPTAAGTTSVTGSLYGSAYLNGSTTPTIFNGQLATLTNAEYEESRSYNDLNGYTAEIDKQAGDDLLSLSYDEEKTSTYAEQDCFGAYSVVVPGGSSQTFQSVMGRAQFELGQRVNGTLSDNFGSYTDTYTQNGGTTFQSSTQTYQAPRLSLTWRPNASQSVRASIGTSIAPPYIALLNNNEVIRNGAGSPPPYWTETVNSGDVQPETAFGFDVGFDGRLRSPFTVLSIDAYQTILHNQFLSSTSQQGTYTCTATNGCTATSFFYGDTAPLYVTRTANLGHSEYEGVELSLHRTPPTGWGYRIQGSLQRAFVYDLPAGFYNTPAGPNTANLGVLPNINFQANGAGYNAMSSVRVPYSTGYGEINYRGRNGAYFLAGITYYGSNNSYDEPAFEVLTSSFTQPLTRHTSLQLSIYNLTNAYSNLYYIWQGNASGTILTPLENGKEGEVSGNVIGPSTARLTLHVDL